MTVIGTAGELAENLTFREFPSDCCKNGQDVLSEDTDITAFVHKF
jgi:hypothetical protein